MRPRIVAVTQAVLLFPATLFMTALLTRDLPQYALAHAAGELVVWYAARMWTLWLLLLALPLCALVAGFATLRTGVDRDIALRGPARRWASAVLARPAALFVIAPTLIAAGILVIVILHMLAT